MNRPWWGEGVSGTRITDNNEGITGVGYMSKDNNRSMKGVEKGKRKRTFK